MLPAGPARLGQLTLDTDGRVHFEAAAGAPVTLNGQRIDRVSLEPERAGQRGDRLDVEGRQFYLVQTGSLFGWRFRDPAAPALTQVDGLDYFPTDPRWRLQARWEAYSTPRTTTLLTSIGTPLTVDIPGEAVFSRHGHEYRLQALAQEGGEGLFSCSPIAPAARKVMAVRVISTPPRRAKAASCWTSIWPKIRPAR